MCRPGDAWLHAVLGVDSCDTSTARFAVEIDLTGAMVAIAACDDGLGRAPDKLYFVPSALVAEPLEVVW